MNYSRKVIYCQILLNTLYIGATIMLEKLNNFIQNTHKRVVGIKLKKPENTELFTWIMMETDCLGKVTMAERVWYLQNGKPEHRCPKGNKRTLSPHHHTYSFCGNTDKCECFREHLKETYVPRDMSMVVEKRKLTWMKKYGADNVFKVPEIQQKRRDTMTSRSYETKKWAFDKQSQGFEDVVARVAEFVSPEFSRNEYHGCFRKNRYSWKCISCGNIFDDHVDYGRVPRCSICFPKTISTGETEISNYIRSLGFIIENNSRRILGNLEYDIYIPEKKIAVEFNGVYWHSFPHKDKKYHVNKFIRSRGLGIHLIQIFDDEWKRSKDIIQSRLRSVLGVSERVFARKCQVRVLSSKEFREFNEKNHLQGGINAKHRYGLLLGEKLVAAMGFSNSRYTKTGYELIRYCSDGNIVGGASKLFKAFQEDQKPGEVISYANRCWSTGNLYEKLGFQNITEDDQNIGFWYVKDYIRYHRSNFTKKKLIKGGADPMLPADEIMGAAGYLQIYDCGNYKFQWKA